MIKLLEEDLKNLSISSMGENGASEERGSSPLIRISLEDDDVSMESAYEEVWEDHVLDFSIQELLK